MNEKLLIIRNQKNISQTELAKVLNISVKQYGYKEKGKNKFYIDECYKIADYLGVKLEQIFLPSSHLYDTKRLYLEPKNIKKESSHDANQELDSNQ